MVKKNVVIIGAIVLALVVAISSIAGTFAVMTLIDAGRQEQDSDLVRMAEDYALIEEIRRYLHAHGLEDPDDEQMLIEAAKGLVYGSGDIYASYFTPEEYEAFSAEEEGEYVGIGVQVIQDSEDGLLTVVQVYSNSPAAKAGIHTGDKIIGVDGTDVTMMEMEAVVNLVKGEEGTDVTISVLRGDDTLDFAMTRQKLISERAEWKMADRDIAYIRLYEFNGNCAVLFREYLKQAQQQGARALIIDLRNNPGGSKDIVVEIADMLLPEGPIIYLENREGRTVIDSSKPSHIGIPIAVLVNQYSASASELLSGVLQDYGMAVIIGETTFGKGVAQSFHRLSNGGVLRLTTERYLTGGGRSVQDVGVVPDIEVALSEDVQNDQLKWATGYDDQYMRALEELRRMLAP